MTIFCGGTFRRKLDKIGLSWVNFQVLRRTQVSLGHKEGVDPKVAADQRGHAIGVAIDTYTESDLESRREAVTKLELALAGGKLVNAETKLQLPILQANRVFEVNEVKRDEVECAKSLKRWSGRRDSNPRRPAWEAGILPLNYSRAFLSNQLFS